jgi:hypothetical protein
MAQKLSGVSESEAQFLGKELGIAELNLTTGYRKPDQ